MRAGFELYRGFDQDVDDNRDAIRRNGRLTVPVLAVGGAISNTGALVEEMVREVADNVTGIRIPETGHWMLREQQVRIRRRLLPAGRLCGSKRSFKSGPARPGRRLFHGN